MSTGRLYQLIRPLLPLGLGGFLTLSAYAQPPLEPPPLLPQGTKTSRPLPSDEIIARVPVSSAPIESVALAQIEIALHQARRKTMRALCPKDWMPKGAVRSNDRNGPHDDLSVIRRQGDYWHYHVRRKPQPFTCRNRGRMEYFLEMSRNLPDWVMIRPAGLQFVFREGSALRSDQLAFTR